MMTPFWTVRAATDQTSNTLYHNTSHYLHNVFKKLNYDDISILDISSAIMGHWLGRTFVGIDMLLLQCLVYCRITRPLFQHFIDLVFL
jgi:hypothetical protein